MKMPKWILSRSAAKLGGWHVQARTADQLSSFVVICGDGANYYRGKTADGKNGVFTLTEPTTMATMNVVGEIEYTGDWNV